MTIVLLTLTLLVFLSGIRSEFQEKHPSNTNKKLVNIKIIEEPSKSNLQYVANLQSNRRYHNTLNLNEDLTLRVKYKPALLNGPFHLVDQLIGRCFDHVFKR